MISSTLRFFSASDPPFLGPVPHDNWTSSWRSGQWDSHKVGFPFNDFDTENCRGYFLKVTGAATFTP